MGALRQDIRFGWRQLLKHPGFTALAILSMALGIGANTAIFSLVDTVLLRPLPVREPSQLIAVDGQLRNGTDFTLQSYLNYKDYRDRNTVFSGLLAYRFVVASLSHNGVNERVWGFDVSGNYFDVLGVKPALGRGFLAGRRSDARAQHPVVILSHACWQKRFAGDPSIIGRKILLNTHPFTVVGVAPAGFVGTEVAFAPEFWVPLMMAKQIEPGSTWLDMRESDNLFVIGRLKPGVTVEQAKAQLDAVTAQMAERTSERERRTQRASDAAGTVHSGYSKFDIRILRSARGRRRARPVTGLRQSGQPPARSRHGTTERNRYPARHRRQPRPAR